jgi:glyoxylase-like metal-dependent hydrolase (beta-lactamase superfamily II)
MNWTPAFWRKGTNQKDYLESLKFLLSLEADILCEGHYGVFRGKEEVAAFIESFL